MSQPAVGIAVVGAGPWGLTLASAFARLPQVQLRWIFDLEDERRARASAAHPDARVTGDLDDGLQDPDVAAVIVAVEPARHHAVSLRALEAGKHLFVEKPLALAPSDADQIHATAVARGCVLSVGLPVVVDVAGVDHRRADFPGGVRSFALQPKGATFEITDLHDFAWELYPVDVEFGPRGAEAGPP